MLSLQQRAAAELRLCTCAVLLRPACSMVRQLRVTRTLASAAGMPCHGPSHTFDCSKITSRGTWRTLGSTHCIYVLHNKRICRLQSACDALSVHAAAQYQAQQQLPFSSPRCANDVPFLQARSEAKLVPAQSQCSPSSRKPLMTSTQIPQVPLCRAVCVGQADGTNAFISQFRLEGAASGPLAGLTLAVKDLYDVSGLAVELGFCSTMTLRCCAAVGCR